MTEIREAVDLWADRQGFGSSVKFLGVKSAVGGRSSTPQSGLYLLHFTDGSVYVGESINLRSRMGGHKSRWGSEIDQVRFKRIVASKQELLKIEKKFIREVGRIAVHKSRNNNHSVTTWSKDVLGEVLSPVEQAEWLAGPATFNAGRNDGLKAVPEQQRTKYSDAYRKYAEREYSQEITDALRSYLEACIPAPRLTEFHGWSVNVGSQKNGRAICVSVGRMETLVVHHGPEGFSAFVNVRKSSLRENAGRLYLLRRGLRGHISPWAEYVDAGGDCAHANAKNPDELRALLADENVLKAAAQLVLDVMRKHPCSYTRYHCPQLVEAVYPELDRDSIDV